MRKSRVAGLLVTLLAGMTLVFAGPAVAQAASQGSDAAEDAPRVEMEVGQFAAIVPQPYTPDPNAYFGPNKCQLYVRDYWPTAGCGGFSVYTKLSHVREQPGYIEGVEDSSHFRATVETSRTFGCMDENGVFDWDTAFEVEEKQRSMSSYYYTPITGYLLWQYRTTETNDLGPGFFVNFAPVEVDCAEGMIPTQHDLKVDDVRISIEDSPVFGDRTWEFGPFTAGSGV